MKSASSLPVAPPPGAAGRLQLLDLLDEVLVAIAGQLPFLQRLSLSLVCRRLRQLCSGPSQMWRQIEVSIKLRAVGEGIQNQRYGHAFHLLRSFSEWLAPRAAAVEEICFGAFLPEPADMERPGKSSLPVLLVADVLRRACSTPTASVGLANLAKLSLEWPGMVVLDWTELERVAGIQALKKLAFPAVGTLALPVAAAPLPYLTDFSAVDGMLVGVPAGVPILNGPCLPPGLTALYLQNVGLRSLPGVFMHLRNLRSLVLSNNRLTTANLDYLEQLSRLEELSLSECFLARFPSQVSALTALRVLYLHNAFNRHARLAPDDWDALRPLRCLAFLSISGNQLGELPPCVAGMTQLRGLHVEDNELAQGLPPAPVMAGLQELLLDWQAALESAAALRAATGLSKLMLTGHRVVKHEGEASLSIPPAEAAEPLLGALGAMPALRCVEDVLLGGEDTVTAPVARVMWQLGRRCPSVELRTLTTTDIGWGLAELKRRLGPGQ